jgi:hypothetical protein
MTEWKTIDSAPRGEDGYPSRNYEQVLVTNGNSVYIAFWNGRSCDDGDFYDDLGPMTHWMPLPTPPTSE